MMERIASATYDASRTGSLKIEGFPDFAPVVTELKRVSAGGSDGMIPHDSGKFKVTSLQPGGFLVIKEPFLEQFQDNDELESIVQAFNQKYNPQNIRLREATAPQQPTRPIPLKTSLVVDTERMTVEKLSSLPNAFLPQYENQ